MSELRWLIFLVGLAFVAGIYLAARRQEQRRRRRQLERTEPVLGTAPAGEDDWDIERVEPEFRVAEPEGETEHAHGRASGADAGIGGATAARVSADQGADDNGAYGDRARPRGRAAGDRPVEHSKPPVYIRARDGGDRASPLPVVRQGDAVRPAHDQSATPGGHREPREDAPEPPQRQYEAPQRLTREPEQLELEPPSADVAKAPAAKAEVGDTVPADFDQVITLYLVPRGQDAFDGNSVAQGLLTAGLIRGRKDIFHYAPPGTTTPVFSVANLVEPGTLREEDLVDRRLPGLTVFMLLPGPLPGIKALEEMVASSRLLANYLDGEVQDDTGGSLTKQTEELLKERIVAFEHLRARAGH